MQSTALAPSPRVNKVLKRGRGKHGSHLVGLARCKEHAKRRSNGCLKLKERRLANARRMGEKLCHGPPMELKIVSAYGDPGLLARATTLVHLSIVTEAWCCIGTVHGIYYLFISFSVQMRLVSSLPNVEVRWSQLRVSRRRES